MLFSGILLLKNFNMCLFSAGKVTFITSVASMNFGLSETTSINEIQ